MGADVDDSARSMTLTSLRDSLVDCLTEVHGARFGETRALLGLDYTGPAVRESVEGLVRLAFTIAGGSYEEPTTKATARVVNLLAERSASWGVPHDEVFEHHSTMMRTLGLIIVSEASRCSQPEN